MSNQKECIMCGGEHNVEERYTADIELVDICLECVEHDCYDSGLCPLVGD